MLKRMLILVLTLMLAMVFVGAASAEPDGNKRKGKYSYRKIYKSCHERGEVESQRPVINPDAKTQAQWTRVFEQKDFEDFGCAEEWQNLSDEELNNIYTYLYSGAADSPTPAKCK